MIVKSPAFQVYAADFLSDINVMVMTTQEVGAYWLLILVCWREGSLPNDVEELAALVRMNPDDFQRSWEKKIRRCFEQSEDGAFRHPRLEVERAKQAFWREKSVEGGRKSGEARRAKGEAKRGEEPEVPSEAEKPDPDDKTVKDGLRVVQPNANQRATLQSSPFGFQETTPPPAPPSRAREGGDFDDEEPIDDAFLDELQASQAYAKLDVRFVLAKLQANCKNKKRRVTRDRLLTWLNTEWHREGNGNGKTSNRPAVKTGKYADRSE